MFDIATRPLPADLVASTGLLFDWSLGAPTQPVSHPWTDYTDPSGMPQAYAEPLAIYALELEATLQTAIILSIFTDARADDDDVLPPGVTDRRGWVGDEFMSPGDSWGSKLWLYRAGKMTGDRLEGARFTVQESLGWMLRTGVATKVVVTSEWVGDILAVRPTIYQGSSAAPVYDVLWDSSVRRGAAS